jgi:hypothetical protein
MKEGGDNTRQTEKIKADKLADKYKGVPALVDGTPQNTNGGVNRIIGETEKGDKVTLGMHIANELVGDKKDKTLKDAIDSIYATDGGGNYQAILETIFEGDKAAMSNLQQKAKHLNELKNYDAGTLFTVVTSNGTQEAMTIEQLMNTPGGAALLPYIEKVYQYQDVKPVDTESKPYSPPKYNSPLSKK